MTFFKLVVILLLSSTSLFAQTTTIKIPEFILAELDDSLRMELLLYEADFSSILSFNEKIEYYTKAEQIAVKKQYNVRYYFILAWTADLYGENYQLDSAILFYKKAIKFKEVQNISIENESYAKIHNALSGTFQDKAKNATINDKAELLNEAITHSKIAVKINPDFDNAWLLLGNAYIHLANNTIDRAIEYAQGESRKTLFQEALSNFEKAISAYNTLAKQNPNYVDLNRNFGVLYRDMGKLLGQHLGKLDECIHSLEKSLHYSKTNFECFRLLGVTYGIKGAQLEQKGLEKEALEFHRKAIQSFEGALEIQPDNVPTLYNIAIAYRYVGLMDKAGEYNAKWKKINPDYNPSVGN